MGSILNERFGGVDFIYKQQLLEIFGLYGTAFKRLPVSPRLIQPVIQYSANREPTEPAQAISRHWIIRVRCRTRNMLFTT